MVLIREETPQRSIIRKHPYLGLVVAVAVIVGVIWLLEGGPSEDTSQLATSVTLNGVVGAVTPKKGEPAPDFKLETLDGKTLSLSGLRGSPVMVNFWATWCPPCRAEMPDLETLYQDNRAAGLVIVGVNLQEDRQPAQRFANTLGLSFPLVLDREGVVAVRYNLTGLPTTWWIDREGIIRDSNIGPLSLKNLRARLSKIL